MEWNIGYKGSRQETMEWTHPLLKRLLKSQNGKVNLLPLTKAEGPMENLTLLGIDIAKNVFQLHGVDEKGNILLRKRLTRNKLPEFIAQLGVASEFGL